MIGRNRLQTAHSTSDGPVNRNIVVDLILKKGLASSVKHGCWESVEGIMCKECPGGNWVDFCPQLECTACKRSEPSGTCTESWTACQYLRSKPSLRSVSGPSGLMRSHVLWHIYKSICVLRTSRLCSAYIWILRKK